MPDNEPVACPYCGNIDLNPTHRSIFCPPCGWEGHLYRMLTTKELAASAERSAGGGYHKVAQWKRQILASLQSSSQPAT